MSVRQRYIELDLLRSAAILGMIVYHTAYDLQMLYGWDIDVFSGGWKIFQITIAALFLLLVGVTAAVTDHRTVETPRRGVSTAHRAWRRFLKIGAAALLVSIVTYVIDPETYVRFGILHLIAVAGLLMPCVVWAVRRSRRTSLRIAIVMAIFGSGVIALGPIVTQWSARGAQNFAPLRIPLGITPAGFVTVDYFPLIPWFGVVLIGYGIGHAAYNRGDARFARPYHMWKRMPDAWMTWPGRHSLLLYLIHQPIILGTLWLILGKPDL